MSHVLITRLKNFSNYKLDINNFFIQNLNKNTSANIEEFLEIINILDSNYIKYQITTDFEINILPNYSKK